MNSLIKDNFPPLVTKKDLSCHKLQRKTPDDPDHFDSQIDLWSQTTTFIVKCAKKSF